MNAAHTRSKYYGVGVFCAVAMTVSATLILLWWGFSLPTAVIIALLISCPLAALYAWWLAHRALRPLDAVGCKAGGRDSAKTPPANDKIHSGGKP